MFPGNLPSGSGHGVLFENRVITFGVNVQETSLERPWKSTTLLEGNIYRSRSGCALERFGNDIFVIGVLGNQIERYDVTNNEFTTLTTLPYKVYNMATVAYKDNIIILGGSNNSSSHYGHPFNDVLMYNIHTLECKRLPSMLKKRSLWAAVIMGDVIVVMGGCCRNAEGHTITLNTVEYFVIGETTWQELPAMNLPRYGATACVYV